MAATYQVWIKNRAGTRVAVLTDETGPASGIGHTQIRSLYLTHLENHAGSFMLQIDGRSRLVPMFQTDCQLEVYRRVLNSYPASDWYLEWEGFFIGEERRIDSNGDKIFIAHGVGYLDLAFREEISYYATTAYTDKSGDGETVIKEFVEENIGSGAVVNVSAGRLYSGVRLGLTVEADQGRGSTWDGQRSWKSLGKTIQEIAIKCGLAFDIVGTGAATFEFRVYEGQRGEDRSIQGLVSSSGLNSAGNPPIVFSDKKRNMRNVVYSKHHGSEINTFNVLGRGDDASREITLVENAEGIAASDYEDEDGNLIVTNWNRRVDSLNAFQQTAEASREDVGEAELAERVPKETFTFEPVQSRSLAYGVHYSWGDVMTAQIDDIVRHKKLIGVKITLNNNGENIQHDFSDVVGY